MIRIGIAGYGNLGRGVESALSHTEDMELVGVFHTPQPGQCEDEDRRAGLFYGAGKKHDG